MESESESNVDSIENYERTESSIASSEVNDESKSHSGASSKSQSKSYSKSESKDDSNVPKFDVNMSKMIEKSKTSSENETISVSNNSQTDEYK